MNSPPPITSRANRRRALSLDSPATPLLSNIGRRRSDRRVRDEAALRIQRLYVVPRFQCSSIYAALALLYTCVIVIVFYYRRQGYIVPSLPHLDLHETRPDVFNPFTAWEHLAAYTTSPHPYNSLANVRINKEYLRDQFKVLLEEAQALGRRNVRYEDRDNSTWTLRSIDMDDSDEENSEDKGQGLIKTASETIQHVQGDNMVFWIGGVVESIESGVPVQREIDFDQESQAALLLSAHLDSVPTSFGSTDNGGGIAVLLTLMRHFIHHPVHHTLIFNLNNGEENGCIGANSFMGAPPNSTTESGKGHVWAKYVKAFLNLDGAGSGGPSLLFRASDHNIVKQYADNAPFPHASVIANDVFKFGLIDSETDYSAYIEHGIPGIDFAFYRHRAFYHTSADHHSIESLHHMGSNVQATVKGICNSDYLDTLSTSSKGSSQDSDQPLPPIRSFFAGKSVYFDVLGRIMVIEEQLTYVLINAIGFGLGFPVLAVVLIYAGRALRKQKAQRTSSEALQDIPKPGHSLRSVLDTSSNQDHSEDGGGEGPTPPSSSSTPAPRRRFGPIRRREINLDQPLLQPSRNAVLRTTGLVALIALLDVVAVVLTSLWLAHVNPYVRNTSPWLVLICFGLLLLFVQTAFVWATTAVETKLRGPVPTLYLVSKWTLALGVWWWAISLVVGTIVAASLGMGALYGAVVMAVFSSAAALMHLVISHWSSTEPSMAFQCLEWVLVVGVSVVFPGIVLLDQAVLVVYMTSQSISSGWAATMYIFYGLLLIPIMLQSLPTVTRARNFMVVVLLELLALVLVAQVLTWTEPFTQDAPTHMIFTHHYDQSLRSSRVVLECELGDGLLYEMLKEMPTFGGEGERGRLGYQGHRDGPISVNKTTCNPIQTVDEACEFRPGRQVFEDAGQEPPVKTGWSLVQDPEPAVWQRGQLWVSAADSRHCTINITDLNPGREWQAWADLGPDQKAPLFAPPSSATELEEGSGPKPRPVVMSTRILEFFPREMNQTLVVHVRVRNQTMEEGVVVGTGRGQWAMRAVCGYNEWKAKPGYAQTFQEVTSQLPGWVKWTSSGADLFEVSVERLVEFS